MTTTLLLAVIPAVYLLVMLLGSRTRRVSPPPVPADALAAMARPSRGQGRLLRPRKAYRLMKKALALPEEQPAVTVLRAKHQALTAALKRLERDMRRPPLLPLTPEGEIRMLALSRETLRHGDVDAALLKRMLEAFERHGKTTLAERLALPLCLRVLLADRLTHVSRRMLVWRRQALHGRKLAARFARGKISPEALDRHPLPLPGLSALLTELRSRGASEALTALDAWLGKSGSSAAAVARQEAQEQSRLAGSLTRIAATFQMLEQLDWPRTEEGIDPLHKLLMDDPSDIYPRMDLGSRILYRRRAAQLARAFRASEEKAVQAALTLCDEAQEGALEKHVGWYLLDQTGTRALGRALRARFLPWLQKGWCYRAGLWVLALLFSFLILGRGYTLWLLPFLLPVTGCASRAALGALMRRVQPCELPRLELRELEEDMRTLVVLPAKPRDRHEAIQAVKQLATARRTMPEKNVDCLLLCDWEDCMTQRGGGDDDIALAIATAIDALNEESGRWLYLHRARAWCPRRRAFGAREGRHGAIGFLCRLIASGEADEEIDYANFELPELHRHYAWVMVLEENTRLEPGALLTLAGTMAHPLNTRIATAGGHRGISLMGMRLAADPDASGTRLQRLEKQPARLPLRQVLTGRSAFEGVGLIRPDALMEGADGWILPETLSRAAFLAGELAGSATLPVSAFQPAPATLNGWLLRCHERARQTWELLPWLFPFVKTPAGVKRNPLNLESRFALRERFRQAMMPLFSLIALMVCVIARDPWLLLLMLLAPEASRLASWRGWQMLWTRLVFLPLRAVLSADAAIRAFLRNPLREDALFVMELTAQSTACAAFFALSAAWQPFFLPGLLLGGVVLCFPLLHRRLDAPEAHRQALSDTAVSQLTDIAEATWRFFEQTVSHALPPESVQTHPDLGPAETTTPEAAGLYLLSCLAAREMGLIRTGALGERVRESVEALESLPHWQGLFFARYHLEARTVAGPQLVPAAGNGVLCACLLTVAQGLRAFLSELNEEDQALPARIDALAARMRLRALYDPASGLFREHADPAQAVPSAPLMSLFTGEGLLCSFVAVMRREVPFEHLARLQRTMVSAGLLRPMLSRHGSAAEAFLPFLLLPAGEGTALWQALMDAAQVQARYGLEGIFGVSQSALHAFDNQLRYLTEPFGVPETAVESAPFQPVFAPYACALTLPFLPQLAADSLQQMRALGMFGHTGFLEAVDFTAARLPEQADFALVRMQSAAHQGMLLCAVCNALTHDALRRCFSDIPMAGACTLLNYQEPEPLLLPLPARFPAARALPEPPMRRVARPDVSPVDAHLIGTGRVSVLVSARGSAAVRLNGLDVTRFSGDASVTEGPQVYLRRGDETVRLLSPAVTKSVVFSEGAATFTCALPGLTVTTTMLVDPVAAAAIQIVELMNDSALEERLSLASCLVPATDGQVSRPQERMLTVPCGDATLCYSLHTSEALDAMDAQTDLSAFGPLDQPFWVSDDEPIAQSVGLDPCLAFRADLRLRARGRVTLLFAARLIPGKLTGYSPASPIDLTRLSRLAARALADSLPLSQSELGRLSRLTGALMWRGQAHQGPVRPLSLPFAALEARGLAPDRPILAVVLMGDGGMQLLKEAAQVASWLTLSGRGVTLCALCGGDGSAVAALAEDVISATVLRRHPEGSAFVFDDLSEQEFSTLTSAARLTLIEGHGSLEEQLDALAVPLLDESPETALPGKLPDPGELLFDSGLSGFDPQTGDCVLHAIPGGALPDWRLPLNGGRWQTLAHATGLGASEGDAAVLRSEQAFVLGEHQDGFFSATPQPFGHALPWQVRFSPGVALWRTRTDTLDVTLTAASIPRRTAGLRTLRLRNQVDHEQRLTVHLAALFSGDLCYLTPVTGGITAQRPDQPGLGFITLCEGGCVARVMTQADFGGASGVPPLLDAPCALNGDVALLSVEITLAAGGSATCSWMTGYAQQADDVELLLHRARRSGASAVYRSVRQQWAQRVGRMVFSTPETSLDLLVNHWLPYQFLNSDSPMALAAQALLTPESVRPHLLLLARDHTADGLLPWLTARYVVISGDEAALNDLVPHDPEHPYEARDTLYARCLIALKAEVSGLDGLGRQLVALRAFAPLADEPDQVELLALMERLEQQAEELLRASDPPDAASAAWAVLGLGPGARTAQAAREALEALYDPMHGLVARSSEQPQDTSAAILLAMALARLGWVSQAWELCRALNPIHHTDDPGRLGEYRGEAFAMASGAVTTGPRTGCVLGAPSAEAAALMYLLIVEELLGLEKQGDALMLRPAAPEDWEDFSITLREGASIWHVQLGAWETLSVDGETAHGHIPIRDDAGVHEVRAPLKTRVTQP